MPSRSWAHNRRRDEPKPKREISHYRVYLDGKLVKGVTFPTKPEAMRFVAMKFKLKECLTYFIKASFKVVK